MVFAGWDWDDADRFEEVTVTFNIHNDIEYRDGRNGLYLIACTPFAIGDHGAYFGLQTAVSDPARGVLGKGAVFSRWYDGDEPWAVRLADTRIPEDGWTEAGDYEGDFVSVRGSYEWGEGQYTLRVSAEETDDVGRWFGLYVNDTWIGSLRFALDAQIKPYCATPIELYGQAVKPSTVPYWKVSMEPPVGDGVAAELVKTYYPVNVGSLRNALITVEDGLVTFEVGMDHIPDGRVDVDWRPRYLTCLSDCSQIGAPKGVSLSDLSAEATFINPTIEDRFEYGLTIRGFIQIWIASDRTWEMNVLEDETWAIVSTTGGELGVPLDTSREGENHVQVTADGNQGCLFVNNEEVACFELPANPATGDVWITSRHGIVGYRNFAVSER